MGFSNTSINLHLLKADAYTFNILQSNTWSSKVDKYVFGWENASGAKTVLENWNDFFYSLMLKIDETSMSEKIAPTSNILELYRFILQKYF